MNYVFGRRSTSMLETCHPDLVRVANRALVITPFDYTIICGIRGKEAQNEAFASGASKVTWPDSSHNAGDGHARTLSDAFDAAPWIYNGIKWSDEGSFYVLAGVILAAAKIEGVRIRYGGDWDHDGLTEDQSFMDLGHFERLPG